MRLLVTGGAGYVGSVVAALLLGRGHDVTVLDSLARGHRAAVPAGATFVEEDLRNADALREAIEPGFDGALHFAALALVGESVEHPERYWATNVGGTRNLLDALRETNTPRLVFLELPSWENLHRRADSVDDLLDEQPAERVG